MANKYEIITKREFSAPAAVRFVWVKQYTIVKRGAKKFAVVRFSNNFDAPLEEIYFTLEQIDAAGKPIDIPENEYSLCIGLNSGVSFEKEFAICEECDAIVIKVQKIRAGNQEYRLENGQVEVATNDEPTTAEAPSFNPTPGKQYWKLFAVSLIAAIIILGINLLLAILQG